MLVQHLSQAPVSDTPAVVASTVILALQFVGYIGSFSNAQQYAIQLADACRSIGFQQQSMALPSMALPFYSKPSVAKHDLQCQDSPNMTRQQ